jgi:hypothetical protein
MRASPKSHKTGAPYAWSLGRPNTRVVYIVLSPSTPDGFPRARIVGFCFFVVCQNRRVSDLEHDIR